MKDIEIQFAAALAAKALESRRRVKLDYNGFVRVVEVHAVGLSATGETLRSVWQVRGGSRSGEPSGWKTMRLDRVTRALVITEVSEAPRPGYRRDARLFQTILCQL